MPYAAKYCRATSISKATERGEDWHNIVILIRPSKKNKYPGIVCLPYRSIKEVTYNEKQVLFLF